jgi:hypothetical protein
MYGIFDRFAQVGPLGERDMKSKSKHFTIKTININLETPSHIEPPPFTRRQGLDQNEVGRTLVDYFVWFLRSRLNGSWSYDTGVVFFEHVDEIVIYHDGVEMDC